MTEAIAVRLTNSLPSNPFRQWKITDISIVNEYFVCIDFHTALGNATIQFNKICVFLYISLRCCYYENLATVATFSFLRTGANG